MNPKTSITWYIARNHEGKFSCGESDSGDTRWTDELVNARFHETIGPVKAAVTKWVKRHPDLPIPQILEWTIDIATAKVIDVATETNKRIERAERMRVERDERTKRGMIEHLKQEEHRLRLRREEMERTV